MDLSSVDQWENLWVGRTAAVLVATLVEKLVGEKASMLATLLLVWLAAQWAGCSVSNWVDEKAM